MQFNSNLRPASAYNANLRRQDKYGSTNKGLASVWRPRFYRDAPRNIMKLQELNELCVSRVKFLQALEDAKKKEDERDRKTAIDNAFHKYECSTDDEDCIQHFLCRLAFCTTQDDRSWFLTQEVSLFRERFGAICRSKGRQDEAVQFAEDSGVSIIRLAENEVEKLLPQAYVDFFMSEFHKTKGNTHSYSVPFTDALDLIRNRDVVVFAGQAFISDSHLLSMMTAKFRHNLSQSLAQLSRTAAQVVAGDARLVRLLGKIRQSASYLGRISLNDIANGDRILPEQLDGLVEAGAFPLCMRQVHHFLRSEHHLKHSGRMQYGLFLKGIGVTLDDSIRFWKSEFTKKMDEEQFDKHYAYNIRHNYGKEGKQISYSPYSCPKIINSAPSAGDCSGCPFKHSDIENLGAQLGGLKLKPSQTETVVGLYKAKNFQSACTRVFEFTHGLLPGAADTIAHPNQYFKMSKDYRAKTKIKQEAKEAS